MPRLWPAWHILETLAGSRPMETGELHRLLRLQKPIVADPFGRLLTKLRRFGILAATQVKYRDNGRPPLRWRLTKAGAALVELIGVAPRRYELWPRDLGKLVKSVKILRRAGALRPTRKRSRPEWWMNRHLAA